MYKKPAVEKFGSFRELTQVGITGASDGFEVLGITGCTFDCPSTEPSAS